MNELRLLHTTRDRGAGNSTWYVVFYLPAHYILYKNRFNLVDDLNLLIDILVNQKNIHIICKQFVDSGCGHHLHRTICNYNYDKR